MSTPKTAPDFGGNYWPLPWFNETDLGCFGNILSANNEPVAQVQPLSPALEPDIVKRNKWRNHVAARISATINACASMRDPAAEIQVLRDAASCLSRLVDHGHAEDCLFINRANAPCDCGVDQAQAALSKLRSLL